MIKIVGQDSRFIKTITCRICAAILNYTKADEIDTKSTDEGVKIMAINCPACKSTIRVS